MPQIAVILIIALVIFGPSRLPSLGQSIGEALKGFKKGVEEEPPGAVHAKETRNELSEV